MAKVGFVSPRWRKIRRDLLHNKGRSIAVILAIMIGVFSVGMIINARIILAREMNASYAATNPMHALIATAGIDEQFLRAIERVDGVENASGRAVYRMRSEIAPNEFVVTLVTGLPSYDDIPINTVSSVSGEWPPPERKILLEQSSLEITQSELGDELTVLALNDRKRDMSIEGLVYDPSRPPAQFSGMAVGFTSLKTLEWLGGSRLLTEIYITVSEKADDMDHIQGVASEVESFLARNNIPVVAVYVPIPDQHPVTEIVDAVTAVLVVLGFVALLIASILIFNTMSALLTQQTMQIGIMKSMGADSRQLYGLYLTFVMTLGLIGTLLAIPLSIVGANALTTYVANLLNFDIATFSVEPAILGGQLLLGVLAPLVGGYFPIRRGARMTVREALASQSAGAQSVQSGWFERFFTRLSLLSRPMLLAFRNMFRRKGRLVLSLITLTLGGAIVVAIFSLQSSVLATLDEASRYWQYDVEVSLFDYQRRDQLLQQIATLDSVEAVEDWNVAGGRRIRPNDSESDTFTVLGVPPETELMDPILIEGRWLRPTDENKIVVDTLVMEDEPDLVIGDSITLDLNGRESSWELVGIVRGVIGNPVIYANNSHFARVLRKAESSNALRVVTTEHSPEARAAAVISIEELLEARQFAPEMVLSTTQIYDQVAMQFDILIIFLVIMAVLVISVATIGLAGTMSINIMERISEVGVLRALGASRGVLMRIIIFEGIMSSLISWFFAGLLAWPLSNLLGTMMGEALMNAPLTHAFAAEGLLVWLVIAILVGVISSLLPAIRASRLSIREVLSYE